MASAAAAWLACGRAGEDRAPGSGGAPESGAPAGSGSAQRGPAVRGSAAAAARLAPVAELRAPAVLVAGTRRVALWQGAAWLEPAAGRLADAPVLGRAIARAAEELGPLAQPFLGLHPILGGGDEHDARQVRFEPAPRSIALDGTLVQVATTGDGGGAPALEVWRYERALRTELAVLAPAGGALVPLPGFSRRGPAAPARSPVSERACAAPKVLAIAGGGGALHALVAECHPAAPVRIATYRWRAPGAAGPPPAGAEALVVAAPWGERLERTTVELGSRAALGVELAHLLATRDGTPIAVGRRGDAVAVLRVDPAGRVTTSLGPAQIEVVTHAAVADDGAIWVRTLGRGPGGRDAIGLARDGAPVEVMAPGGARLRPEGLAADAQLGIVVLAQGAGGAWLFAERAAPGPRHAIPR